jgi:hypothetical protein
LSALRGNIIVWLDDCVSYGSRFRYVARHRVSEPSLCKMMVDRKGCYTRCITIGRNDQIILQMDRQLQHSLYFNSVLRSKWQQCYESSAEAQFAAVRPMKPMIYKYSSQTSVTFCIRREHRQQCVARSVLKGHGVGPFEVRSPILSW